MPALRPYGAARELPAVVVLLAGPEGEGACLMPNELVGQDVPADREAFFGAYGPATDPVDAPTPARDRILEFESMEGSTDEGWFSWTQGYVGSDVAGVTVHTSSGPDVEASVERWPVRRLVAIHQAELRPPGRDVVLHGDPRRRQYATCHRLTRLLDPAEWDPGWCTLIGICDYSGACG